MSANRMMIPPRKLVPYPGLNPRRMIPAERIEKMKESIREEGVLQNLVVHRTGGAVDWIVAGVTRWRAASLLAAEGVAIELPAHVDEYSEERALAIAMLENMHRGDLTVVEEARGLKRLHEEFGRSQTDLATEFFGDAKKQPLVSNRIRLLELPEWILDLVEDGSIHWSHARDLLVQWASRENADSFFAALDTQLQSVLREVGDSAVPRPTLLAAVSRAEGVIAPRKAPERLEAPAPAIEPPAAAVETHAELRPAHEEQPIVHEEPLPVQTPSVPATDPEPRPEEATVGAAAAPSRPFDRLFPRVLAAAAEFQDLFCDLQEAVADEPALAEPVRSVLAHLDAMDRMASLALEPRCEQCGCTESHACPEGCGWHELIEGEVFGLCDNPACLRAAGYDTTFVMPFKREPEGLPPVEEQAAVAGGTQPETVLPLEIGCRVQHPHHYEPNVIREGYVFRMDGDHVGVFPEPGCSWGARRDRLTVIAPPPEPLAPAEKRDVDAAFRAWWEGQEFGRDVEPYYRDAWRDTVRWAELGLPRPVSSGMGRPEAWDWRMSREQPAEESPAPADLTVNMWLQEHAEGIGRKTAQGLHGQFASVAELVQADEDRIFNALMDSRLYTMPGSARKKAAVFHGAIQDAAVRLGLVDAAPDEAAPEPKQDHSEPAAEDDAVTAEAGPADPYLSFLDEAWDWGPRHPNAWVRQKAEIIAEELRAVVDWAAYKALCFKHGKRVRKADWQALVAIHSAQEPAPPRTIEDAQEAQLSEEEFAKHPAEAEPSPRPWWLGSGEGWEYSGTNSRNEHVYQRRVLDEAKRDMWDVRWGAVEPGTSNGGSLSPYDGDPDRPQYLKSYRDLYVDGDPAKGFVGEAEVIEAVRRSVSLHAGKVGGEVPPPDTLPLFGDATPPALPSETPAIGADDQVREILFHLLLRAGVTRGELALLREQGAAASVLERVAGDAFRNLGSIRVELEGLGRASIDQGPLPAVVITPTMTGASKLYRGPGLIWELRKALHVADVGGTMTGDPPRWLLEEDTVPEGNAPPEPRIPLSEDEREELRLRAMSEFEGQTGKTFLHPATTAFAEGAELYADGHPRPTAERTLDTPAETRARVQGWEWAQTLTDSQPTLALAHAG